MGSIGEDIVLLAVKRNGTIAGYERLCFAIAGSELVRLALTRRIEIDENGYITVLDASRRADEPVDPVLTVIEDAEPPLDAEEWVARQPTGLVSVYLERLSAAGTIRAEDRKVLGLFRVRRWAVLDTAKAAEVKGRLDAIALTTGPITPEQAAFAGLVHAAGLGVWLYPRPQDLGARNRLGAIARQDGTAELVSAAAAAQNSGGGTWADTAMNAAIQAATWSSVNAAHRAIGQHHPTGHGGGSHDGGGGTAGGHHG